VHYVVSQSRRSLFLHEYLIKLRVNTVRDRNYGRPSSAVRHVSLRNKCQTSVTRLVPANAGYYQAASPARSAQMRRSFFTSALTLRGRRVCLCVDHGHESCKTAEPIEMLFRRQTRVDPKGKGKGSPYSITERRVPELIPVLSSQPAGDVNHKPDGRLPLFSARPAVIPAILKRAAINFAAW